MTKIYLVRHAEAEGNLYRIAHGHYNGLITDRGYEQIAALQRRFEEIPVDAVYSSDLFRARTTAKAIYGPKSLPLITRQELREVDMGCWEGRTWQDLTTHDPEQMYNFNRNLAAWKIEGGESAAHVRDRMIAELQRIASENEGKTVAVVSHGAALRITLGSLQGLTLEELGQTPHGDNTAVSLLEAENGQLRVVFRDDNSHLTQAGLSTFVKQTWWKTPKMFDNGEDYGPLDEQAIAALQELGVEVAPGSAGVAVSMDGHVMGVVEFLPELEAEEGIGWIGQYWIAPDFRARRLGIPPLGQAVQFYRAQGRDRLRLRCGDGLYRGFFEKFGFHPVEGDVLEKSIGYEERI